MTNHTPASGSHKPLTRPTYETYAPVRGADPDLLDEDELLEEQPYVRLEADFPGTRQRGTGTVIPSDSW